MLGVLGARGQSLVFFTKGNKLKPSRDETKERALALGAVVLVLPQSRRAALARHGAASVRVKQDGGARALHAHDAQRRILKGDGQRALLLGQLENLFLKNVIRESVVKVRSRRKFREDGEPDRPRRSNGSHEGIEADRVRLCELFGA